MAWDYFFFGEPFKKDCHRGAHKSLMYGAVVFAAVFFVGWITGMGGSFIPNLGFSILMGVFPAICFSLVISFGKNH